MTHFSAPTRPPSGPSADAARRGRRLLLTAGLSSAVTALIAALWLIQPAWNGFAEHGSGALSSWFSAAGIALSQLVLGLLGMGVIAVLGYLLALAMPVILAFVVIQLVRRGGRARWVALGITAVVLIAGLASGLLTGPAIDSFRDIVPQLPSALMDVAPAMLLTGTALVWAVVSMFAARTDSAGGRTRRFVLRHRRLITVLAAMGPLPYGLLRLSWLTPWPLMAPEVADPGTLFWGFALSLGAWAGSILTIGLIRPWGEVFPRWLPAVAERPVPVAVAAIPGGVVAGAVCAAAIPLLRDFGGNISVDALLMTLVMPFWFWGPMLALAVWGYVLHRQAQDAANSAQSRPDEDDPLRRRAS